MQKSESCVLHLNFHKISIVYLRNHHQKDVRGFFPAPSVTTLLIIIH